MGCKCDLKGFEKSVTTSELVKDKSTLEISKIIGRYHQTLKGIVAAPMKVCKRIDKSHLRVLFTNPSARAGYDTRSIFKRSLTGLNSEFSFS